jgi:hypothetical protein
MSRELRANVPYSLLIIHYSWFSFTSYHCIFDFEILELGNLEIAISKSPNFTFPNHSVLKLFTGFAIAALID